MVPDYAWPDPEQRADQLVPVALELAERIRTEPVRPLLSELLGPLDGYETWAVVALLAAAVDPTQHPDVLFGWARHRDAIEHPSPVQWADDELPIEEVDSEQINQLIAELAGKHRSDDEIAEEIGCGLTAGAVAKRRRRMGVEPGLRRGHVRTAREGGA